MILKRENFRIKYVTFFGLFLVATSCMKPETVKTIAWNNDRITLSIFNGGATVSYLYKIEYKGRRMLGKDRLIFWSYSTPAVDDISVKNDTLTIHCFERENETNKIIIDLKNIDKFIGSPVRYRRSVLEKTNSYYKEPDFIKRDRHGTPRL